MPKHPGATLRRCVRPQQVCPEGLEHEGRATFVGFIWKRKRVEKSWFVPGKGPRDIETFAEVICALDSVTSEESAYRIAVDVFVRASSLDYGAVWLPQPNGELQMIHQTGTIAAAMDAAFPSQSEVTLPTKTVSPGLA